MSNPCHDYALTLPIPGGSNIGGSSQYNPSHNNIGGSSQTGGADLGQHILPDNYGNSRNPNCPVGGSSQSNRGSYDPSCYWSQYGHDHHGDHHKSITPMIPINHAISYGSL